MKQCNLVEDNKTLVLLTLTTRKLVGLKVVVIKISSFSIMYQILQVKLKTFGAK